MLIDFPSSPFSLPPFRAHPDRVLRALRRSRSPVAFVLIDSLARSIAQTGPMEWDQPLMIVPLLQQRSLRTLAKVLKGLGYRPVATNSISSDIRDLGPQNFVVVRSPTNATTVVVLGSAKGALYPELASEALAATINGEVVMAAPDRSCDATVWQALKTAPALPLPARNAGFSATL